MKQKLESNRGITIISLVVTIIVLIILASVTINVMIGKNSVLDVTKTEKYNTQRSMLVETLRMELLDRQKEELEPLKDNEISEVLEKHGKVVYTDKEEIDGVIVNEEFDIKLSEIWENSYREEHIKLEVEVYTGIYDGKAHDAIINVTTNPAGAKIEYAIENGKYSSTIPQVTGANTYSISVRATKEGYIKAEKTVTVTVRPQTNTRGNLVLSETSGTITYPNNGAFTVTKNTSGGALSVTSSDTNIATASISGTTVTITPKAITTDGKKTTITVTSAATSNYEAQTATYEVTINRGTIDLDATPYSGNYDGKAHNALTAISTNPTGTTIEYSLNGGAYSTTMPQVTGASTYSISIRATKAGYAKAETTKTITVNKQTNTNGNLTLSETSGIITYPNNGTFTVTKNTSGGALSVKSSDESIATASISGTTVTITPKAITTDGKKTTIIVTSAATSNYEAQTAKYEVTINRGTIDLDATIYTGVYDGQSHDAVSNIKVVPNDAKVEYSIDGGKTYTTAIPKVTNAGEFAVTIKANKAGYKEKVITKEKGKIDRQKSATVSTKNGTYDGTMQTGITGENVEFSGTVSAINAGEYKANVTPKSDYAWSDGSTDTKEVTFTINKRTLTVTAEAKTKTYGEANPALTYKTAGAVSGQTAKFNGSLACSATATSGVGTYDITQGTLALADNGTFLAGNYQIAYTGAKLTVNAKNASTFTATLATTSYTYDGTAKTPAVTVKDGSTALTNGTHYTVAYSNNVNAGTGKVTITGKGNYTGTKEVTFTINKRAITVTAEAKTKKYGEANPALTYKTTGAVSGQTPKFNGSLVCSATATSGVGTYDITQGTLALADNGTFLAGNYQIAYTGAKLTVNAKNASTFTATLATTSYTYDGTAKTPAVTVKDGSTALTNGTHYTVAYSNNVNAGTGKVTITGKGNYTGTKELTFTINKRAITVTAGSSSKTYNGTALTNSSATLSAGTLASGQTLTASATGTITNAGSVANTVSTAVVKNSAGTDVSSNYTITKVNGTLTINKATGTLSLSATSGTITYPNNGSFTITSNTSGGTLSVTSSYTSVATASISGTTVTITPKAISTDGKKTTITITSAETTNYVAQSKTYVATVNRGTIKLSFSTYNGVYDGKEHLTITNMSRDPSDVTVTTYMNGISTGTTTPKVTNVGTYSITVEAKKTGYISKTITKTSRIWDSEEKVLINTVVNEDYIKSKYNYKSEISISDIVIKNSAGTTISNLKLDKYDIYTVSYKVTEGEYENNYIVNQKYITKPRGQITLTNTLPNSGFESPIDSYFNGEIARTTAIKRSGNYSMYYSCSNNQAFPIICYGDVGIQGKSYYVRGYYLSTNSNFHTLIYAYEANVAEPTWTREGGAIANKVGNLSSEWELLSGIKQPSPSNYKYLQLQISQGNGAASGTLYWDDFMCLVLDTDTWGVIPTQVWIDKMIPYFEGTKTFNF